MSMLSSRRFFIGSLGAAAGCSVFKGGLPSEPDIRFGVLSDVHLREKGDEDTFLEALKYFRGKKVDGVIIAGDIADNGRRDQLQRCADSWKKIFPGGKGLDSRPVEKLFVYGNHDLYGVEKLGDPEKAAAMWEEVFEEPYSDFWLKKIKGFTFVGGHWTKTDQFDGLGPFLAKHASEIGKTRPFFYIQHSHPRDTCFNHWAWGRDNGASTKALSRYPNAVAFSGHSHYSLTDERSVWQGAFTSINTASLRYCSYDYALRENINGNSDGFKGEKRRHLMPQVHTGDSRHGMVVSVYGDNLVIERRDFMAGASLGDDWVINVPCRGDRSYAARAAERVAPCFAPGAKVSVKRDGALLTLSFPAARTVDKCRVFEYEVTATLVEDEVELVQVQRRVMAPDYHKPETPAGVPGSCVLSLDEIPIKGNTVFSVRPMDCYGLRGKPVSVVFNTAAKA